MPIRVYDLSVRWPDPATSTTLLILWLVNGVSAFNCICISVIEDFAKRVYFLLNRPVVRVLLRAFIGRCGWIVAWQFGLLFFSILAKLVIFNSVYHSPTGLRWVSCGRRCSWLTFNNEQGLCNWSRHRCNLSLSWWGRRLVRKGATFPGCRGDRLSTLYLLLKLSLLLLLHLCLLLVELLNSLYVDVLVVVWRLTPHIRLLCLCHKSAIAHAARD